MEYWDKSTINTRGTLSIFIKYFFPAGRLTKHLVDQLSADYIGFLQARVRQIGQIWFFLVACLKRF